MDKLKAEIEQQYRLFHAKGCSVEQVIAAEKQLGLQFPDEYRRYVLEYGAISFGSHEFTGLNVEEHIDVVQVTLLERSVRESLPADCIVVQLLGIEGLTIIQDSDGAIFQIDEAGRRERIADSFAVYIRSLL